MLPTQFLGLFLLAGFTGVDAQAKFEWGFTQTTSTSLPSCQTLLLSADGLSGNNGVPPFYMIAFPIDGTPMTSFIGTNESGLSWQVQYPTGQSPFLASWHSDTNSVWFAGTQLLLGVVDSGGITGGIDTPVYTVTAGASTQCIPPASTDFKMTANVTDVLTACQPWGLTIEGGAPPYTVTIAVRDSHSVTNVTLGPTDSVFTYINSAKDGSQMIASVSDKNGRWATGNPFVNTTGTSTNACAGLASTSGNGTSTTTSQSQSNSKPTENPTPTALTSQRHPAKIGAIIGGSVAGLLLLVALGIWAIWWLRRRAARKKENALPPTDLNAFMPPSFQPSPFDHGNWQMSEAHMSAPSGLLAPVSHSVPPTHSGAGQTLTPVSHFSSDPRWSASDQSYNNSNSTGVPTPTSASPLVVQEELPAPPPYRSNTINIAPLK
ncbi:hypothetical protein C8R47DRAFT_218951 [Mycena vitilis]|nr:hypothetical protein C8R47DRAFT_218951 [Mycena vitilis]